MKRWILKASALPGLDSLVMDEVSTPTAGAGQVRIRVHAVSLNYRDQLILNRQYGVTLTEDLVPVSDGAGEIDQVGAGVDGWKVGDRVSGLYFGGWTSGPPKANMGWGLGSPGSPGMLAEYVVLDADRVARVPASLDLVEAATLPCAALTAWSALHGQHPLEAGQRVLVLGTGGVSLFALLLARAAGASVTATTTQEVKLGALRDLGADDVVNSATTAGWGAQIFERSSGGAQKIVNAIGGGVMNEAFAALAAGGEIALMGLFAAGEAGPVWPYLMAKGGSIRGVGVGSAASFADLVHFIDAHRVKPPIHRRFAFDEAREAYLAQGSRDLFGKIIIEVVSR